MSAPRALRVGLGGSLLFLIASWLVADVGASGNIDRPPGGGGPLCYQIGASQTSPDGAHFWLKVCNNGSKAIEIVICAMLNLKKPVVPDADFKIRKNFNRITKPWECISAPDPAGSRPNAHLGCRLVTIPADGKLKDVFNETVTFSTKFKKDELGSVYFDLLFPCPVDQSCKQIKGKDKFLTPQNPNDRQDWVNTWAGVGDYLPLTETPTPTPTPLPTSTPTTLPTGAPSLTPTPSASPNPTPTTPTARLSRPVRKAAQATGSLVAAKDWPTGNWVTMEKDNTEFFPARLKGVVSGAPAGSAIDFHFGLTPGGHYVVPADPLHPPCGGADVAIDEPFVIPPMSVSMEEDGIRTELPAGACGSVPEGFVSEFHGAVTAEPGAPIYDPGEFMYGVDEIFVRDTVPPVIESVHVRPFFNYLEARVKATDVTTRALGATLVTGTGASEVQTLLNFANPPSNDGKTRFLDFIGPLPSGTPLPYRIDVYDEVSNVTSTDPSSILLGTPPNVRGLACILSLEQQTVQARLSKGITESLTQKLEKAAENAAAGKKDKAIQRLEAYRDELARHDEVDPDVAAELDQRARDCIAELGG